MQFNFIINNTYGTDSTPAQFDFVELEYYCATLNCRQLQLLKTRTIANLKKRERTNQCNLLCLLGACFECSDVVDLKTSIISGWSECRFKASMSINQKVFTDEEKPIQFLYF